MLSDFAASIFSKFNFADFFPVRRLSPTITVLTQDDSVRQLAMRATKEKTDFANLFYAVRNDCHFCSDQFENIFK